MTKIYPFICALTLQLAVLALGCRDELSNRSRQADGNNAVAHTSVEKSAQLSENLDGMYLTKSWPTPARSGFLSNPCPPKSPDAPCESDEMAAITAIDILSRAMHTHASISLSSAVETVIDLSRRHPQSQMLAVFRQIVQCSKKIATPEFEAALKIYNDNHQTIYMLPQGRINFLKDKGIFVPKGYNHESDGMGVSMAKLTLSEALNKFGDRAPLQNAPSFNGEQMLSRGALRCNEYLVPFEFQKFMNESAKYPVKITIKMRPPADPMNLKPRDVVYIDATIENTYDKQVEWEVDDHSGSFSASGSLLIGKLTISDYEFAGPNATVRAHLGSEFEARVSATLPIRINFQSGSTSSSAGGME